MDVAEVNKDFYNKLYRKRHPLVSILYSFISFDQQSKSKINYSIIRRFLRDRFNEPLSVLDYGFGHGSLLLKYKKQHLLFGCDISEEAVRNFPAVARFAGRKVVTATVDEFLSKFNDVRFDIITLSHIIEHVDDDAALVKTLSKKLSVNGVMLINIPINEVWDDPKHVRKYDIHYINKILEDCGLRLAQTFEADKFTSFFLIEERVKKAGRIKVYCLKSLRAVFSIMPMSFTRFVERFFLRKHKNQQLIVLVTRK